MRYSGKPVTLTIGEKGVDHSLEAYMRVRGAVSCPYCGSVIPPRDQNPACCAERAREERRALAEELAGGVRLAMDPVMAITAEER